MGFFIPSVNLLFEGDLVLRGNFWDVGDVRIILFGAGVFVLRAILFNVGSIVLREKILVMGAFDIGASADGTVEGDTATISAEISVVVFTFISSELSTTAMIFNTEAKFPVGLLLFMLVRVGDFVVRASSCDESTVLPVGVLVRELG
jgi:hypothetical protein